MIGLDPIRVSVIYRSDAVVPLGDHAVLDTSVDPRFNDDRNRPAVAQSFVDRATGGVTTVVVNHLKSKGSPCDDVGDPDLGDGAGRCNLTRLAAAEALVDWLATDPTGSGQGDVMIIGDLNSYDEEDPIQALLAGGYVDLGEAAEGEFTYTYVFDGQWGMLDYAFATTSLTAQVTGVTTWHINSDEPDVFDYNTSFRGPGQQALYSADAFRASDHDPVIVGLDLDLDAEAVIGHAIDEVAGLFEDGLISKGEARSTIISMVDAAELADGVTAHAADVLLHNVEARVAQLVADGTLTAAQAAAVTDLTNAVRSGL